jgi:iron complex outermembrane receptor protein
MLLWALAAGNAMAADEKLQTLKQMSIDDLANLEVSIVSGRPERLADAAAAVFVITAEDIRRSGATTLAEVLRMVPGMSVGRIDTGMWAVSARGFQNQFANKLLVLIDGRSVYTPLFSGVYWESQDIVLQDIERIEVVRGPGATTWGANAVNGVINILTKRAEDTQGTYIGAVAGDRQRQLVARQGGRLGESGAYRLYAKLHQEDELPSAPGFDDSVASWEGGRAGFRADQRVGGSDLMVEGGFFREIPDDRNPTGAYLLGRWEHRNDDGAVGTLQGYYYRFGIKSILLDQLEDTFDLEYRLRFAPLDRHSIIAGAGYRWIRSDINPKGANRISEPVRKDQLLSAFIQDDIRLVGDELYLTLGTKLEHNDYTGFEFQPNARLRWSPTDGQTLWAAVSRALRTPSRAESDMTLRNKIGQTAIPILGTIPLVVSVEGNPSMDPEDLVAYEAGYRWQASPQLTLDTSLFLNDYDRLRSIELAGPPSLTLLPTPAVIQTGNVGNKLKGRTYGLEVVADYQPYDWWRIQGAYSYIHMDLKPEPDSTDTSSEQIERESPTSQLTLRSSMNLRDDLELDLWLRYVDDIPAFSIDNYLTLDARLGWRAGKNFDLSLVGRNLLDPRYGEYVQFVTFDELHEVTREVYLMAEWRF